MARTRKSFTDLPKVPGKGSNAKPNHQQPKQSGNSNSKPGKAQMHKAQHNGGVGGGSSKPHGLHAGFHGSRQN